MNLIIPIFASALDRTTSVIVWMPKGQHSLCAKTVGGAGWEGDVICDETSFQAVKASFDELKAEGKRVWIDANHDDGAALAWVKDFSWSDKLGIIAHLEWTPRGEKALNEKEFYSFSPTFRINKTTSRVAGLLKGRAAGGLVNAPAFGSAMPDLIAARYNGDDSRGGLLAQAEESQLPETIEIVLEMYDALDSDDPDFEKHLTLFNTLYADLRNNPHYSAILATL
jgi:phage I-like protein